MNSMKNDLHTLLGTFKGHWRLIKGFWWLLSQILLRKYTEVQMVCRWISAEGLFLDKGCQNGFWRVWKVTWVTFVSSSQNKREAFQPSGALLKWTPLPVKSKHLVNFMRCFSPLGKYFAVCFRGPANMLLNSFINSRH